MQHYISDSIHGLTLAWITSEISPKQLECRHLDSIFFTVAGPHPMLVRLSATVSGVDCPCPCPVANSCQLLSPTNSLFASRYHFRTRRDFKSKNPFVWFRTKTDKGIVCLAGHPYSVTLLRICSTLVHHSSVVSTFKKCRWFYTNLHHYKQIPCVGSQTDYLFNQTDRSLYYWESVAHWCTILLLSAHPKSVAGSTQTFITINKSPVWVVKQITSLTKLIDSCTIKNLWHIGTPFFCYQLIQNVWLVLHKPSSL